MLARRSSVIMLALFFFAFLILASVNAVNSKENASSENALIVPDKYSTIQAAIDHANAGDTIFVRKGMYPVERLLIDKQIILIGENANETIIDGQRDISRVYPVPYWDITISVDAPSVLVSGFTIKNGFNAIAVWNFSGSVIKDNIITDNIVGILAEENNVNTDVSGNSFINNSKAIMGYFTNGNISNNLLLNNGWAITTSEPTLNLTVKANDIVNNSFGITIHQSSSVNIYENNITGRRRDSSVLGYGIELELSKESRIYSNNIQGNMYGIRMPNYYLIARNGTDVLVVQGSNNTIYKNNFADNIVNAYVEHRYPVAEAFKDLQNLNKGYTGTINGTDKVTWYADTTGNYWSDYLEKYPNATEVDASGVGNTPYVIDEDNIDNYPLMQQIDFTSTTSGREPTLDLRIVIIIAVLLIIVSVVASFIIRKRVSSQKLQK